MAKLAVFIAISLVVFVFMADYSARGDQTILGPRGDFFAGFLNPIIGLITLGVLYATLVTMQKDFNRGIETFEQSQELIEANNKQQRFEDTFFSMLNVLMAMVEKIYALEDVRGGSFNNRQPTGRKQSLMSEAMRIYIYGYKKTNRAELLKENKQINATFRMLFQILKHVDDAFKVLDKNKDNDEIKNKAKKYVNIVRATLDSDTYHLLLLNCMVDDKNDDFYKYKKYLASYEFCEHLSIDVNEVFDKSEEGPPIVKQFSNYALFLCDVKRSYFTDGMQSVFGKSDVVGYLETIDCAQVVGAVDPNRYL